MTIADLAGSRAWPAMGWTMIHFLWAGLLIQAAAMAARHALRRARPEARYAAALACLVAVAAAPVLIGVRVAGQGWAEGAQSPVRQVASPAVPPGPMPAIGAEPGRIEDVPERPVEAPREPWGSAVARWADRLARTLPWVWVLGSPATFAVMALGLIGGERLRRASRRLDDDGEVGRLCRGLGESLGVARRVGVAVSDRGVSPILVGVVRPLILLPASALAGWGPEEMEMALLHELAHVRRLDNLVNLAQRVVESILFFQPAVWWISGWARLERERCCDALVVARTGRRRAYASFLASVAERRPALPAASAAAAHPVVDRIRRILEPESPPMKLHRPLVGLGAALTLLPAGLLAAFPPRATEPPPQDAPPAGKAPASTDPDADLRRRVLASVAATTRPDDVHALRSLARVQHEAGDRDAARATMRRAIEVAEAAAEPQSRAYNLLFVAQSQTFLGDRDAARETLRRLIVLNPQITDPVERVATLAHAGRAQAQAGDKAAADETIARATALLASTPEKSPDQPNMNVRSTARLRLADALVEMGEIERAVELSANEPDSINGPLLYVTRAIKALPDRDRARAILRRIGEIGARSRFPGERGQALASVAAGLAEIGDFDEAIAAARRIGEGADANLNRNYLGTAIREVAEVAARSGRRDQAVALFREGLAVADLQRDSMRSNQLRFLAQSQAKAGDFEGARRSVAAIDPAIPSDLAEALIGLASGEADAGNKEAARAALGRAAEAIGRIGPRSDLGNFDPAWTRSYTWHHLAVVQAKLGDYAGAVATLRDRTGDEFSERANGLNDVVEVQVKAGDLDGALQTALALKVDDFRAGVGIEAVARAQARAGDAAKVLAWSDRLEPPYVKARALIGMLAGLADRDRGRAAPAAK